MDSVNPSSVFIGKHTVKSFCSGILQPEPHLGCKLACEIYKLPILDRISKISREHSDDSELS